MLFLLKVNLKIGESDMKKEFAVIGLGRFGGSICRELSKEGMDVLAIDIDADKVNEFKDIASHALIADTTDENVLKEIGIRNVDHVIVAIGDHIQNSILTSLMLKELGIKKITVKAQNDYHEKILKKIGADYVVHPERDMGKRIAHNIISSNVLDYLELSDEHSVVEVKAGAKMSGKTLVDLDIRANYGCNVVAIKKGREVNVSPMASEMIENGDILIVIGADKDISRFEKNLVADDD
jgi:trk system potassium uptake protein